MVLDEISSCIAELSALQQGLSAGNEEAVEQWLETAKDQRLKFEEQPGAAFPTQRGKA